jgi:hypothetical protein
VGLAGYTQLVHKHPLMGRAPGGASRAGALYLLIKRIVPDDSDITALIYYIYVVSII